MCSSRNSSYEQKEKSISEKRVLTSELVYANLRLSQVINYK